MIKGVDGEGSSSVGVVMLRKSLQEAVCRQGDLTKKVEEFSQKVTQWRLSWSEFGFFVPEVLGCRKRKGECLLGVL